jgi:hypothetical protein
MVKANRENIYAAANELLDETGKTPTMAKVREKLGGGSYGTISPILAEWRDELSHEETDDPSLTLVSYQKYENFYHECRPLISDVELATIKKVKKIREDLMKYEIEAISSKGIDWDKRGDFDIHYREPAAQQREVLIKWLAKTYADTLERVL